MQCDSLLVVIVQGGSNTEQEMIRTQNEEEKTVKDLESQVRLGAF